MDTSKEIASDTVASDTLAEKPKPDPQVQDSKSIKEEASHTVSSGNGIPNVIASSPNSLVQKKNICLSKLINVSSKSNPERTNDNELKNFQHSDLRALVMPVTPGKASEDGYNWRKYGQKNVKSSEFVRSYYKCTHPTCQVKKQVERTRYGQIMDTVYLGGKHDHPKAQYISVADAQPISVAVASVESMDRVYLGKHDHPKAQSISVTEAQPVSVAVPSAASAQEETMGEPTTPGGECKSCSAQVRTSHISESSENPKPPAVMEGVIVSRNAELKSDSIVGKVCNAENSEPKRRKLECCIADASWADKQSTESCLSGGLYEVDKADKQISDSPVVVRTTSNADIVNDGYRWRKYGQKLVKGNPNPRSYYRCSNVGCPVKKHVERACHDPKVVITTYEGRHDHNVPATRTITTNTNPISSSPRVGSIESDIVGHEVIVRYSLHSESGRPNDHCLPDAEPVHS